MPITPTRELQEISFKPAQGGLISETRRKTDGGRMVPDWKTETAVHPNSPVTAPVFYG